MQKITNTIKKFIPTTISNKVKGQLITIVLFAVILSLSSFHGAAAIAVTLKIFGFGYNMLTGIVTLIMMPHIIEWILNRKAKTTEQK